MYRGADSEPVYAGTEYVKVRDLSAGSSGNVHLACHRNTGEHVAIKFMSRDDVTKRIEREVLVHSSFQHPHVVEFKGVFLTRRHLAVVMEYAEGGDLFNYVNTRGCLEEDVARSIFQQVISALDYCHRLGVVNRDVKLENCLIWETSSGLHIKLTDFGYSKSLVDSAPKSLVGTPGYTAPEVISAAAEYDGRQADVWSTGVMLFIMLYCCYPFERTEDEGDRLRFQKVMRRIMRVDYQLPTYPLVSAECKDLLRKILVGDPSKRLTIQHIMLHPWYLDNLEPHMATLNEECLLQRPHEQRPGLQTPEEIEAILKSAKGTG